MNFANFPAAKIPHLANIQARTIESCVSYGAKRTSKRMKALSFSKASAEDAPDLPPQRGLLCPCLISGNLDARQFRGNYTVLYSTLWLFSPEAKPWVGNLRGLRVLRSFHMLVGTGGGRDVLLERNSFPDSRR